MVQNVSVLVTNVSLRKMCILLLLVVSYRCPVYPVDWWCCFQLCPRWFSACWSCLFLEEGCWSFTLWQWIHLFLLVILSVFASCSWSFLLRHTHIKTYVMPFISDHLSYFNFALSKINITSSALFWLVLVLVLVYFLNLFTFNLWAFIFKIGFLYTP